MPNLHDFHFIRPLWLLALIPYLAIVTAMLRRRLGQVNWSAVCDAALLPYLLQGKAERHGRASFVLGALAALIAIAAMAGPSWQRLPAPVFRNASALVIALDLSRSMDAEDVKPSRLIRARYKIADLLGLRKDGQTALLVYSGDAFTVTPLTDDTETIASQLEALTTDIMPSPGKNTAAALNRAVGLLKQAGMQKGQIVLMSDSVVLDDVLPTARSLGGYSLSVIGVGTREGAPIALPSGGFLKDGQGSIVIPKLNIEDLAELARVGKGIYRSLTANDADIRDLLASIDEPGQHGSSDSANPMILELWEDKGPWLLLLALPLAALSFRKGLLGLVVLWILPFPQPGYALDWRDLWLTKDQQGARAFEQKRYDEASGLFENPDWKLAAQYKAEQPVSGEIPETKTATGFYNRGNVLAKSGRLEEAIEAYNQSLARDPDNEDARYNKRIVEKELEKQKEARERNQQSQGDPQQQNGGDGGRNQGDDDGRNQDEKSDAASETAETRPEHAAEREESSADRQQPKERDEASEAEPGESAEARRDRDSISAERQDPTPAIEGEPAGEQQQANEQWLNRIPDDPAGLLRRKFKYQYGRRRENQ
ncbi:MAG: VWA domain-containing protein [Gammaproteobacteria bacterium]